MACRKCKSDWVGLRGRDCSSCPHCDKVQRCIERKRGRWTDKEETKPCKQCGNLFTCKAFKGTTFPRVYCSTKCRNLGKAEWRRTWMKGYAKGVRKQKQLRTKKPLPACKQCGQQFKRQQGSNSSNIYCSKACFFAARASGKQSWDKTNIRKASWHLLGPYSSAPSVMAMRQIAKCWTHVFKCQRLFAKMLALSEAQRRCEVCSAPCGEGASRFCSYKCGKAWRGDRSCAVCSATVPNCKAHGRIYCVECKAKAKRKYRKQYKRELGSHRKKVRKGGGFWNSSVRRSVVLSCDRYRCYLCNTKCKKTFAYNDPRSATVDMVVPASKGGDWDYHNLRCACRRCNSLKSDKLIGQLTLRLAR